MSRRIGSIAVDSAGNAVIAGYTQVANFPASLRAFDTVNSAGQQAGFVSKLNAAGTGLIYSTYFGISANAIALDANGDGYVVGSEPRDFSGSGERAHGHKRDGTRPLEQQRRRRWFGRCSLPGAASIDSGSCRQRIRRRDKSMSAVTDGFRRMACAGRGCFRGWRRSAVQVKTIPDADCWSPHPASLIAVAA